MIDIVLHIYIVKAFLNKKIIIVLQGAFCLIHVFIECTHCLSQIPLLIIDYFQRESMELSLIVINSNASYCVV